MRAIERRLARLEQMQPKAGPGLMPNEIWIVAAGDPENRALLWRAAHGDKAAASDLAGSMGAPLSETLESIERFKQARQEVIDKDDC